MLGHRFHLAVSGPELSEHERLNGTDMELCPRRNTCIFTKYLCGNSFSDVLNEITLCNNSSVHTYPSLLTLTFYSSNKLRKLFFTLFSHPFIPPFIIADFNSGCQYFCYEELVALFYLILFHIF